MISFVREIWKPDAMYPVRMTRLLSQSLLFFHHPKTIYLQPKRTRPHCHNYVKYHRSFTSQFRVYSLV